MQATRAAVVLKATPLGYRPALDGLRGLAILAVIGVNADWRFFGGGFLGVDIFFVLSGFLITTILVEEWEQSGTIHLKSFFARRAIRLMPALLAMLMAATAYSLLWRPADQRTDALKLALASLLYASNWVMALWGVRGTLEHTWSLAVEGQFYVVWGLALWVILRRGGNRREVPVIVVASLLAAAILRSWLWATTHDFYRVYMGLDTRADTLLAGCLTAFAIRSPSFVRKVSSKGRWMSIAAALSAATIIVCIVESGYYDSVTYFAVLPLVAVATCLLLFFAVLGQPRWVAFVLEVPMLVWIGKISYSMYLWHVPLKNVLAMSRLEGAGFGPIAAQGVRFVVFVAAGCASYYLVERPFLKLKARYIESRSGK